MATEIDHSTLDARRKRLLFRCQHCGTRENDILIGGFAERRIAELDDGQLERLETLLHESDNDLQNWITGKEPVPDHLDHDVMTLLIDYRKNRWQA